MKLHPVGNARVPLAVFACGVLGVVVLPIGCGESEPNGSGAVEEAGTFAPDAPAVQPNPEASTVDASDGAILCNGLECQVVDCGAGPKTSIRGTVYDPAGNLPLYNAVVYVPKTRELPAITPGASCERCGSSAIDSVASALTDVDGHFTLENVPVGADVPLVVQIGKWRKEIRVNVEACKDNPLSEKLTLPKNQQEGSLPRIAASLGPLDPLVCLLRRFGVSDSEFTLPGGGGAIQAFEGCRLTVDSKSKVQGQNPPESKAALWDSAEHLMQYDIVLLSCEGAEFNGDAVPSALGCGNKTPEAKQRMRDFLNAGGRVFATHYHNTWFKAGPDELKGVAEWGGTGAASDDTASFRIDRSFPKGASFGEWLKGQNASTTGEAIELVKYGDSVHAATALSQRWIYGSDEHPVKFLTFNTPVTSAPDQQCGRAVVTDVHLASLGSSQDLPGSCGDAPLSAQEKALMFLLMDLASCVQDDQVAPQAPN